MIPRHLIIGFAILLAAALGLSLYAWHMRKSVAAPLHTAAVDTRPLAPPVSGPSERVVLFIARDDDGTLRGESAQIPMPSGRQQRAEELLRALLSIYLDKNSPHHLGAGAEIRSVYLVDPGVAVIDLNSAFADTHRMLNQRISIFCSLPLASLDRLSLQRDLDAIGQDKALAPARKG